MFPLSRNIKLYQIFKKNETCVSFFRKGSAKGTLKPQRLDLGYKAQGQQINCYSDPLFNSCNIKSIFHKGNKNDSMSKYSQPRN